jgi:hypothetical protein
MGKEHEGATELRALVEQGRFLFLQLAQTMLQADLASAGFSTSAQDEARRLKAAGARLVLEVAAERAGGAGVSLVPLSPAGEPRRLAIVRRPVFNSRRIMRCPPLHPSEQKLPRNRDLPMQWI